MSDLHADYAEHGFRGRLGFGERPAVLVVDMVRAYVDPASPLYAGAADSAAAAARVVAAARSADVPVAFTGVRYQRGGIDGGLFWQKIPSLRIFEEGSPLGDFVEDPAPQEGDVVVLKQYASAFFGSSLASTLQTRRVDTLLICGWSTSGCVRATAVDALQLGFRPAVVREAVGDRDARPHEANLLDIEAKYGDVVSEAEAVSFLEKFQGSPDGHAEA